MSSAARSRSARHTGNVSLHLRAPSPSSLRDLVVAAGDDVLTYSPTGISVTDTHPDGYHRGRWARRLGAGDLVFERDVDALRTWRVHRGAGLIVEAAGPPAVGLDVAMAAPLPVGYVDVVCRVVEVIDEPDRHGFAYGTLSVHPEQGEESFVVTRTEDGSVDVEIVAVSRLRHPMARAVPPIARVLQSRATARYLDALEAAVDD